VPGVLGVVVGAGVRAQASSECGVGGGGRDSEGGERVSSRERGRRGGEE